MGVLTDYFRAGDAASVVRALERTDGGPLLGVEDPAFDGVEAKGVDPVVMLGNLIAAIQQVPWSADLIPHATVWPTTPAPGPEDPAADDDPWATGPWVSELGTTARDTLADVPAADVPAVVTAWARTEELEGARTDDVRPLVEELIQLARRARDNGERMVGVCGLSIGAA